MSSLCSWVHLSKRKSSFLCIQTLLVAPPHGLMVVVPASYALNLAQSPNSTHTIHSSSFCCPTLGTTPCHLWPVAAELFPVTQPSDLSSLTLHLGDCGHFYLNNVCSVIPLVTKNQTLPWIAYAQDSLHVLSHLGAISLRAVILFIQLLHHTAPVSIFYTVNSGQVCFLRYSVLGMK